MEKEEVYIEDIAVTSIHNTPIWDSGPVTVDLSLSEFVIDLFCCF